MGAANVVHSDFPIGHVWFSAVLFFEFRFGRHSAKFLDFGFPERIEIRWWRCGKWNAIRRRDRATNRMLPLAVHIRPSDHEQHRARSVKSGFELRTVLTEVQITLPRFRQATFFKMVMGYRRIRLAFPTNQPMDGIAHLIDAGGFVGRNRHLLRATKIRRD